MRPTTKKKKGTRCPGAVSGKFRKTKAKLMHPRSKWHGYPLFFSLSEYPEIPKMVISINRSRIPKIQKNTTFSQVSCVMILGYFWERARNPYFYSVSRPYDERDVSQKNSRPGKRAYKNRKFCELFRRFCRENAICRNAARMIRVFFWSFRGHETL